MACNNALLGRYKVYVDIGCGADKTASPYKEMVALISANTDGVTTNGTTTNGWIYHVTKVSGLGLGEEGTMEVPDWLKKTVQADGKRNIPQLGLQFKYMSDRKTFTLMAAMFNQRATIKYDFQIHVTDKAFNSLYYYEYTGCEMLAFNQEDQELGQSKLIYIDTKFTVDDVKLCDTNGTVIVSTSLTKPVGAGL